MYFSYDRHNEIEMINESKNQRGAISGNPTPTAFFKYSPHSYLDILSHICASCISYVGTYEIDFILLQEKRPSKIVKNPRQPLVYLRQ